MKRKKYRFLDSPFGKTETQQPGAYILSVSSGSHGSSPHTDLGQPGGQDRVSHCLAARAEEKAPLGAQEGDRQPGLQTPRLTQGMCCGEGRGCRTDFPMGDAPESQVKGLFSPVFGSSATTHQREQAFAKSARTPPTIPGPWDNSRDPGHS